MTGDGMPDNAAAGLLTNSIVRNAIGDPNELIAENIANGSLALLVDSKGFEDLATDCHVGFNMFIGEDRERTLRGLDLLHFDGDKLVRKITYKQD